MKTQKEENLFGDISEYLSLYWGTYPELGKAEIVGGRLYHPVNAGWWKDMIAPAIEVTELQEMSSSCVFMSHNFDGDTKHFCVIINGERKGSSIGEPDVSTILNVVFEPKNSPVIADIQNKIGRKFTKEICVHPDNISFSYVLNDETGIVFGHAIVYSKDHKVASDWRFLREHKVDFPKEVVKYIRKMLVRVKAGSKCSSCRDSVKHSFTGVSVKHHFRITDGFVTSDSPHERMTASERVDGKWIYVYKYYIIPQVYVFVNSEIQLSNYVCAKGSIPNMIDQHIINRAIGIFCEGKMISPGYSRKGTREDRIYGNMGMEQSARNEQLDKFKERFSEMSKIS